MTLTSFWFQTGNHKKWFASDPEFDAQILDTFGDLLINIDDFPINQTTYDVSYYLENILICDQLTRHFDRVNQTKIGNVGTQRAIHLSLFIIKNNYEDFLKLSPEKQCFILLPLRHTRRLELVKQSISEIYRLMEIYINDDKDVPNIYSRFYKASLECLAEIMIPTYYSPSKNVKFPETMNLLDPTCQFNNDILIGYNKNTQKKQTIPSEWIKEFKSILPPNNQKIMISLSGGGDSMTTSYILKKMNYDVTAVMVDYNNRESCKDEVQMVHWWCSELDIPLYVLHIEDIKRSRKAFLREIYEPVTRKMRFNAYKKVANLINAETPMVVLGHNRDDSFENIISNLTKKRSMYNLKAIKPYYLDNEGVWVYRPFHNISKSSITQFLQDINGPFLYDSTPEWSFRGRTRDILVPQLNSFDENLISGLEDMADKMFDMSQRYFNLLEKNTKFEKTTTNIKLFESRKKIDIDCIKVDFMTDNYTDASYWLYIFEQLMIRFKYPMIGNKAIINIIKRIDECKNQKRIPESVKVCLILNMECRIYMDKGYMIVYHRPKKPSKKETN